MSVKLILLLFVAVATVSGYQGDMRKAKYLRELVAELKSVKDVLKSVSNKLQKKRDWHPFEEEFHEADENKLKDVANVAYLRSLVNTAKHVVGGVEADDSSKMKAMTELESLSDKFIGTVRDMKANKISKKTMALLKPLKDEVKSIERDMEAKLALTNDKKELKGMDYLQSLVNTAKNVVGGMKADDVSKGEAMTQLKSLADKFVDTVRDMKAKEGSEKVMVELEPFKDEMKMIVSDAKTKLKLKNNKKELKDVDYLRSLVNRAKNVVGGMKEDDVSKGEAITHLKSIADKFVNTVRDMKAKEGNEKAMVELEPFKDEMKMIESDVKTKLKMTNDKKELKHVDYLRTLVNTAKNVVGGMEEDEVSKLEAVTELKSLAHKFADTLQDMKAKKDEDELVELEPLMEEVRNIASDMKAKL